MQRSAVEIYDHGLPLALTFRGVLQVNVKLLCRPEVVLTSLHMLPVDFIFCQNAGARI